VYVGEEGLEHDHRSTAVFSGGGKGGTDGKQTGLFEATEEIKPGGIQIARST
jgi:hypothetical protein